MLECDAAIGAVADHAQDTPPLRTGALDVLAQHVLGSACGEPFVAGDLYREVKTAAPYGGLSRKDFDDVVDFVATGGYALKAYERFAKIRQTKDGRWQVSTDGRATLPHEPEHPSHEPQVLAVHPDDYPAVAQALVYIGQRLAGSGG